MKQSKAGFLCDLGDAVTIVLLHGLQGVILLLAVVAFVGAILK